MTGGMIHEMSGEVKGTGESPMRESIRWWHGPWLSNEVLKTGGTNRITESYRRLDSVAKGKFFVRRPGMQMVLIVTNAAQ